MEHFVTHFNRLFIPQGLALYDSLIKHVVDFKLWIVCVDQPTYEILNQLNFPNIHLINLNQVETKELLIVKKERTIGEYCWTLTPFLPRFVFESNPKIARITYLDADLWFLKDPAPIYREFEKSGKQVLITDHSYSPEYDKTEESGQYCVQFLIFNREGGEFVRKWWEEKCIEWCYNRHENGRFGDQKYLDSWPESFGNDVHVLSHPEWTLAPWNAKKYQYSKGIFFHFQGLKLVDSRKVNLGSFYILPPILVSKVYNPYIICLKKAISSLNSIGYNIVPQQQQRFLFDSLFDLIHGFLNNSWCFTIRNYKRL